MHVILATEIWGRTPHVDSMAARIEPFVDGVSIIEPYDGADPEFLNESNAYENFLKICGHRQYAERVRQALLEQTTAPAFLIGFSAGAGAVWAAATEKNAGLAKGAICFYGSAIRNMADLRPTIPVDLIFPEHEPHFDVDGVIKALECTPQVTCRTSPHRHGFMNPLSPNYDARAYEYWMEWIEQRLKAL